MNILVAEDYAPIRRAVQAALAESGYTVDSVSDGGEARWAASTGEYDCIVLDWMLPTLSGIDLVRALRADEDSTPVLMLTARDATEDRVQGLDSGADDYLVKPFALEELLARVRALVRRRYASACPLVSVGDLDVDTVGKRVHRAGKPIDLTAREYALLHYLVLRAGEVVSRTDIWNHLYGLIDDSHSNVVDVYIGYLRRKLAAGGGSPMIRTIRGQGYVLEGTP
ncbi:Transcriptional activator protein CzcR [Pirellulimonas nuda]|uniref:Transcriptional activator protein CzcR n=1 Tax=Pirellulimonas nuda TaxID=2528009 RepID=A0A518D8D7_9BACT|nr:response regulator transcription factor [Pirellulimonas nuda]QDU87723.1 Transcriptional activator protein CzcR [Pirellulimonas nuda]